MPESGNVTNIEGHRGKNNATNYQKAQDRNLQSRILHVSGNVNHSAPSREMPWLRQQDNFGPLRPAPAPMTPAIVAAGVVAAAVSLGLHLVIAYRTSRYRQNRKRH